MVEKTAEEKEREFVEHFEHAMGRPNWEAVIISIGLYNFLQTKGLLSEWGAIMPYVCEGIKQQLIDAGYNFDLP